MVTKYDVFEIVYGHRSPIKPIEAVKQFCKNKSYYNLVHRFLTQLVNEKLLVKAETGFQGEISPKATQLFRIISFCLHNNLNYNLLLDKRLVRFLNLALSKGEIGLKTSCLNSRTLNKYIDFLSRYGLILVLSNKPLRIKVFYNVLVKNLLIYFNLKPQIKEVKINYLKQIAAELKAFRRFKSGNEAGYKRIFDEQEIHFVHHSLSLEGNPITLSDTFKILKDNVIPMNSKVEHVDEVKNYQKAILLMIKDSLAKEPLTLQTVLSYHQTALAHHPDLAGKIRDYSVHIQGNPNFKIAKVEEIKPKLNSLFKEYQKFISQKNNLSRIIQFAAYFHNQFQHIHPFGDGNSRTTRLLMFHILQFEGIPFLDIPFGLLDEYMIDTKKYLKRNDQQFYLHLQKIILFNLKQINTKLH